MLKEPCSGFLRALCYLFFTYGLVPFNLALVLMHTQIRMNVDPESTISSKMQSELYCRACD